MHTAEDVIRIVEPLLLPERLERMRAVVQRRMKSIAVVTEALYDAGNRAAIYRSAEAHGFLHVHVIRPEAATKPRARAVSKGAEKWLHLQRHASAELGVSALRACGYQVLVADLRDAVPLSRVDLSAPTALVFGNERDGISPNMRALADGAFTIPMVGFVESLNVSVAAAITLAYARDRREEALGGASSDLTPDEAQLLYAAYLMRAAPSALRELHRWYGQELPWLAQLQPRP